jgi:hypothetical protein
MSGAELKANGNATIWVLLSDSATELLKQGNPLFYRLRTTGARFRTKIDGLPETAEGRVMRIETQRPDQVLSILAGNPAVRRGGYRPTDLHC